MHVPDGTRHICDRGDEFNDLSLTSKEAKLAARLFAASTLQHNPGNSGVYIGSDAEERTQQAVIKLGESLIVRYELDGLPHSFDDAMLMAKAYYQKKGK